MLHADGALGFRATDCHEISVYLRRGFIPFNKRLLAIYAVVSLTIETHQLGSCDENYYASRCRGQRPRQGIEMDQKVPP